MLPDFREPSKPLIYKYPLEIAPSQTLSMPGGLLAPLSIQVQGGEVITLWAIVDKLKPLQSVTILMAGTGHPLSDDIMEALYIGTVQHNGFVWHYFVKD